ncbi:5'/3'-nucleotidase SurE [Rubrobacter taiwanensis]|jgi:5'-nucleotidase|uniref:5'-nucleotidase SurE n=1 Tax=Rubrobacter taiwanensis TaxID=185139 RepID=A0A4V2NW27_9ACTN|nr:5'/3'-nucleotidase SurE [Rubrobacter taiwanensis]TCJ15722.1 5'/3'-nucleotidase SurE [Rubrobacter taiwanensis]
MRVLLTNDDGIDAPGIQALKRELERVGEVLAIAPDRNRSGVGRSISIATPLHVEERTLADGSTGYACNGTPVDCVRLVALGLMDFEPDVVISGINHGENLGDDITYSGTVAAAFEGIVIGVPGIAVSLSVDRAWHANGAGELHFEPVAEFTARLARVAVEKLPPERILNINAPNVPRERVRGARITRLGRRVYMDELVEVEDENGRTCYDIYNHPPHYREEEGTDFAAVAAREISVTPVHLNLTDHTGLQELESWDVRELLSRSRG